MGKVLSVVHVIRELGGLEHAGDGLAAREVGGGALGLGGLVFLEVEVAVVGAGVAVLLDGDEEVSEVLLEGGERLVGHEEELGVADDVGARDVGERAAELSHDELLEPGTKVKKTIFSLKATDRLPT